MEVRIPERWESNGAEEKDINLKIALNIKSYLEKENIEVFMTRTSDEKTLGYTGGGI